MKGFFIYLVLSLFALNGTLYFLEEYNVFIISHLFGGALEQAISDLFFLALYALVVLWTDEYIRDAFKKDKPQE